MLLLVGFLPGVVEMLQEGGGGTRLLLEQESQQLCFWSAPLKCCRFPHAWSEVWVTSYPASQLCAHAALLKHSLLLGVHGREHMPKRRKRNDPRRQFGSAKRGFVIERKEKCGCHLMH